MFSSVLRASPVEETMATAARAENIVFHPLRILGERTETKRSKAGGMYSRTTGLVEGEEATALNGSKN